MVHRNSVEFLVWGENALFSDPVTRVGGEKCSYQIPTYEALKGVLHSIYWKPTLTWYVDAVRILKPIQTQSRGIRPIRYNGGNDLAIYTYLKDVAYQVRAHFEWNLNRPELAADRNEHKHHNIARRMIERGGRRDIFLGARECQAYVEPCTFETGQGFYDGIPELAFGYCLHGFTYPDEIFRDADQGWLTVRFWWPVMRKGVIEFPRPEEIPAADQRQIRPLPMKTFGENNFSGLKEFAEAGWADVAE